MKAGFIRITGQDGHTELLKKITLFLVYREVLILILKEYKTYLKIQVKFKIGIYLIL